MSNKLWLLPLSVLLIPTAVACSPSRAVSTNEAGRKPVEIAIPPKTDGSGPGMVDAAQNAIAKQDLEAQQAMAVWAERMFWSTSAQALFSLIGLILLGWTLLHTRRAANFAGDMAEEARLTSKAAIEAGVAARESVELAARAQRPWVSLNVLPDGPLMIGDTASTLTVELTMENQGDSPATNVEAQFKCWKSPPSGPDLHQQKKEELISSSFQSAAGFTIFPGRSVTQSYGLQIENFTESTPDGGIMWLIAMATYGLRDGIGRTMVTHMIFKLDPTTGSLQGIRSSDAVIPQGNIRLHRLGIHESAE